MSRLPKGIRRRGSSFVVDLTVDGRRKTGSTRDLDEAKALRARFEADLRSGEGRAAGTKAGRDWTLGETLTLISRTASPHGWQGARAEEELTRQGRLVVEFFSASVLLKDIGLAEIEDYARRLEDRRKSNGTINHRLAALSRMMTFAHRRGGLAAKPFIPRRKTPASRLRYLTRDEEAKLVSTFRQWGLHDCADAVEVLIDTGMRCGELDRLTDEDVDHTRKTITVWITKNERPRVIPMTERVQIILAERGRRYGGGRLFPYKKNWLRHPWDRVRGHLGYAEDRHFVPHILRHTCASRLAQGGANVKLIAEWLGHRSLAVTNKYMVLAPTSLNAGVALLEAAE